MGIGNPRGCSFDPDKPSYLYCSIVVNRNEMKEEYEVLLIDIEGGNRIVVVRHSGHLPVRRLPSSITGGFLYRGLTNPSLEGRYLYMYGSSVWAATETPEGSGRYASASIPMAGCSTSSPMACGSGNGAHGTIAGRVMSFGEDNNRDAFLFSTGGIYRVVRPALCHRPSTAGDEMNLLLTQPSTLTPMQAGGLLFVAGFVYVIRKLIPC